MSRRNAALLILPAAFIVWQGIAGADPPNRPNRPDRVTICHKPGTPAQKTLTLPAPAARNHMRSHGDTPGPCPEDVTTTTEADVTTTTEADVTTTTEADVTTTTEADVTTTTEADVTTTTEADVTTTTEAE